MIRTYEELIKLPTFAERLAYLNLNGQVGSDTFGFDRYLNQVFYKSYEWKKIRNMVIARDNGCDLGIDGLIIGGRIIIHHMNPISPEDLIQRKSEIMNPQFLICTSHRTHNAIHYGDMRIENNEFVDRTPNDTSPWRK